ncbi:hypothetical protein EJC51_47090 [Streptomyces aquilus]|uniref:Uncharacterized protein n=1 Tax=Streptomyces aquilus TaxID=2548456 RepID=A0A3Q9C3Z9_9ACTN|nr:hypothetical protein [Streptomyces aquilus]AZP14771.1 hypothetical protein EJC51_00455 [Streptomyces aquilus]AZP22933.1 hypothetical protein EJC51_47090 [Streptomyces aquilus]
MLPAPRGHRLARIPEPQPIVVTTTPCIPASGRPCGCGAPHCCEGGAAGRTRGRPQRASRMPRRLLHEALWAAVAGAAYTCGATGTGTVLYWFIHR